LKKVRFHSIQPGFFFITYDPDLATPKDCTIPRVMWDEMRKKGFYGGIILQEGVRLNSLDEKELNKMGLTRIRGKAESVQ
jgi:hypothetical protein